MHVHARQMQDPSSCASVRLWGQSTTLYFSVSHTYVCDIQERQVGEVLLLDCYGSNYRTRKPRHHFEFAILATGKAWIAHAGIVISAPATRG